MKNVDQAINEELNEYIKQINLWYKKNEKTLGIVTVPFYTTLVFKEIIIDLINNNKKIVYIWGKNSENKEILNEISEIYQHEEDINNIRFICYDDINSISEESELAIIDDVSCYSSLDNNMIINLYDKISEFSKRIILYTVEEIKCEFAKLDIVPIHTENPFVEPRFITTRVDLKSDIPYILYEYLEWFIKNKKKIMIIVPDEDKLNDVYQYYTKKIRLKRISIVPISKKEDKKIIKNVLMQKQRATIIITDSLEQTLEDSKVGNAIVLFADSNKYSYKSLLYLCGEIGRINKKLPEVLFVSREVTSDMDKVKNITRNYNKKKWEEKLRLS
jgi:late competence protein required for DNA uptake (superfamily II DNA/RNA helicase)